MESITAAWWKSVWVSTPPTTTIWSPCCVLLSFRAMREGAHGPVGRLDKTVVGP
ncbi:hypothetical protein [Streptomyces gibsoniae]|uniref:Uncharacterized protein n=1 Tax=Streptomyces gibsoniae TaxID=3075529 RepID=A0ABU2U4J0_9ACTN|nr:hypothetical protein [Streptomyces sp. DSM 41699]MDT0468073.1 hypothetical protein [Streptomyces sp. DSM 41699]